MLRTSGTYNVSGTDIQYKAILEGAVWTVSVWRRGDRLFVTKPLPSENAALAAAERALCFIESLEALGKLG